MTYIPLVAIIVAISLTFWRLLRSMAKHRGCNPILWASMGASFWFLPIPFLLLCGLRSANEPGRTAP